MSSFSSLLQPLVHIHWAGNSLLRIAFVMAVFIVLSLLFRFIVPPFLQRLERFSKRSKLSVDDAVISLLSKIPHWAFYLFSFLYAASLLHLPEPAYLTLHAGILIILTSIGVILGSQILEYALIAGVPRLRVDEGKSLPTILHVTIVLIAWIFGILLILSNLGINVISLIAGLGIGGIAVALAVQNILGDIFSAFALYLDKPFREGDFIIVGPHMGVVKKIGLKTTRIQALQGEEIIISNQELTSTRVQNFKRMHERRAEFSFGIRYGTTPEQLKQIPKTVRAIIESISSVRFDRAHFTAFNESALTFEVVYYVLTDDYNLYRDVQQAINLELYEQLQESGVEFAFPMRIIETMGEKSSL